MLLGVAGTRSEIHLLPCHTSFEAPSVSVTHSWPHFVRVEVLLLCVPSPLWLTSLPSSL